MTNIEEQVPDRKQLWSGAILASIVHAIMMVEYSDISHEQSWDGMNYSVQNSMGSRGTITFSGDKVVGVFFDEDSPRNPFNADTGYDLDNLLKGIPTDLRSLAQEEALQYVLQEYKGKDVPVITAAFWSEGGDLAAAEPWPQVFNHGAHLIRIQLMDTEEALARWKEEYEMSPLQVTLARSLYKRKMAAPNSQIELEGWERHSLMDKEDEADTEVIEARRELLTALNIKSP